MTSIRFEFGRRVYTCAPAGKDEVAALRTYIVSIVGEVTPLNEMLRMTCHNADWLNAVQREGGSGYAGAFAILPLDKVATAAFEANEMTGGQITLDHMVRDSGDAASIYVGSILSGRDTFGRAATLAAFSAKMAEIAGDRDVPCYTRPVTKDGQRIVTKLGYRPVMDRPHAIGEMIYRRAPV